MLCTPFMSALPGAHRKTDLTDVLLLIPKPFRDNRGLFTRTFDADIFDDYLGQPGISASFVQDSQSRSARGVIRGLHGRSGGGEAKLIRCANGAVHDVLIDIRRDSPTFGKPQTFLLDATDFLHLYVPRDSCTASRCSPRAPRCAIASIVRTIPPRTWALCTTTPTLRSIGRCRSR